MLSFLKKFLSEKRSITTPLINIEDVVVLDTETGGLDEDAAIHSIAAIRVVMGRIQFEDSIAYYIKPRDTARLKGVTIHGLTRHKLENNGLNEANILKMAHQFIQKRTLVGHHIAFDLMLLNKHFVQHNMEPLPEKNYLCTFQLTKRIERPDPETSASYRLEDVCARWNIPAVERHTAAGDVFSNALLWAKLYREIKKRKISFG